MNASSLPTASRQLFDELLLQPNLRLRVGEHLVDIGALRIVTHPEHPRLTSKAAAVLIELVRHAGDTVMRDQLLDRVWADRVTTPDVLTQAIKELRRAFCDDAKPSRYIETIPKVGYRLLAPVSLFDGEQPMAAQGGAISAAGNDPELFDTPAQPAAAAINRGRRWLWALAAAVVVAAVLAVAVSSWRAATPRDAGWQVSGVRALTSDPGSERRPALSPDGTRVAYAQLDAASGFDRIVLRAIGQTESVKLTTGTTAFEEAPAWSPDGSQIAFERLRNDGCTMHVASILGGAEREVGPCRDFNVNYFDWSPDGKSLITAERSDGTADSMMLMRWDLASGVKQPLQYSRTAEDQDLEAHYSPDGRWLAFRRGLAPYSDLCVMPAAGGAVRQLTELHSRIRGYAWTSDSRGLIFSSNHDGHYTLYSVDLRDAQVSSLKIGPAEYPNAARTADGVVYEIPRRTNRLAQIPLGVAKAPPELLAKSTGSDGSPAVSPDGNHVAFISDRGGAQQIWLYDFATSAATALTDFRDALLINPAWSADGKRMLVTARGTDDAGLIEIDLATRRLHRISKAGQDVLSGSYGPDADNYLVLSGAFGRHNQLIWIEHAGRSDERQSPLAAGIEHAELDPAKRRVYYTKNAQHGLFARDLAGGDEFLVTPLIESSLMDGWRVVDGHIWFVPKAAWKPTDIIEFDPATGKDHVLARLEAELHDVGFSVMPSRDHIVVALLGTEDTDVGAFRFAASAAAN